MTFRLRFAISVLVCAALLVPSVASAHSAPFPSEDPTTPPSAHEEEGSEDARRGSSLQGPVLGFLFDGEAHNFRPILGIPGAAVLGEPLRFSLPVERAEVSPGQDFAVGTVGSERMPAVLRFREDPPSIVQITGALPEPSGMFLSPSGTAAVLHYAEERKLQVITGLPSAPSVAREMELFHLPADLTALAVSDNASALLLGFAEGESGSVFLLTADGSEQFALSLGRASALTFLRNSDDALVADREHDKVYLLQQSTGAFETFPLADGRDGLAVPTALAVSGDNRRAFVLNSNGETIVRLDLTGGPPGVLTCPCQPTGLHRLISNSVFRLTERSADPMWLLDADRSDARFVFVPPAAPDPRATQPRVREEAAPR